MFSTLKPAGSSSSFGEKFDWPPDFGRRFLITVDTEEEFDWDGPFKRSGHTTITVPKLLRFQKFVQKYGIAPIYFTDYSVIENDEAAAFLKSTIEADTASVGVHLHPWVNPPFDEEVSNHNSFAGNLPMELEEAKIEHLLNAMQQQLNVRPNIYRAGRYGVGPNTIEILSRQGFLIDGSARSRFDYSAEGGPDFRDISAEPFWLDSAKRLLEIPLTTVYSGVFRKQHRLMSSLANRSPLANSLLAKTKMLERIPLTPEGISAREAKEAIDIAIDDDLQLLVFSFHSPSLSVGHTPYIQNDADLDGFYDWWRDIIDHLRNSGVSPISSGELLIKAGLRTA